MRKEKNTLNFEFNRFDINIEKLEKLLLNYPDEKKQQMISLIQSKDNRQSMSHLMELYTFNRLNDHFQLVEVEKVLEFANHTTPDFWVNNEIAIEVGTSFKKANAQDEQIMKIFNNLESSVNIANFEIKYPNTMGSIKLKEIQNVALQLSVVLKNQQNISFKYVTSQGIELTGNSLNSNEHDHTKLKMGRESNNDLFKYKLMVQRNIRRKLGKYKPIATKGYPLIFVLYDYELNFTEADYMDILYGTHSDPEKRLSAIFSSEKYTSLSAIIGYIENEKKYILLQNPYAKNTFKKYQDKISLAFK